MTQTADIEYTILKADQVYTNSLTPVSALPWNQRGDERVFPIIPVDYDKNHILWDFGDGTKYTSLSAEHVYTYPGDYTISMYVLNSDGNPIKSVNSITVNVIDLVQTQFKFSQNSDVIDIPSGKIINPLTINFTLSWQHYTQHTRNSNCESGKEHWMTPGKDLGSWMCGETHVGDQDSPIYTFNMYCSGSNSEPINIDAYNKSKSSHLDTGWAFTNAVPELSTLPIDHIDVTLLDSLTGSSGDYNTYELLYYAYIGNEYQQVSKSTPGATLVGLSGNASFYYTDSTSKSKTTRDSSVIISAHLDGSKLLESQQVSMSDKTPNHLNTEVVSINNVKTRVNPPAKLGVTCNGLNDFQINKNKWVNNSTTFTITVQDFEEFNIIDSTSINDGNISIKLTDINDIDIDPTLYTITPVSSGLGYYTASVNVTEPIDDIKIVSSLTYNPTSGFSTDAIVAWFNSRDGSYGEMSRIFYYDQTIYDDSKLTGNMYTTIKKSSTNIKSSGIISTITLSSSGSSLLRSPKVTATGTGTGAVITTEFDDLTNSVSSYTVVSGGVGYDSTTTLDYELFPQTGTAPSGTINLEDNYDITIVAASLCEPGSNQYAWGLETGVTPRIARLSTETAIQTYDIADYDSAFATPVDISLDANKNLWVAGTNRVLNIDVENMTLLNNITDITSIKCIDVTTQYIAIASGKQLILRNLQDVTTTVQTKSYGNNIKNILCVNSDKIYILLNNNKIKVYDIETNNNDTTIQLPISETFSQLTTTIDFNIYTASATGILYRITSTGYEILYDLSGHGASIVAICSDSRGFIWLSDDSNKCIWLVDAVQTDSTSLAIQTNGSLLKYGHVNKTSYPTGFGAGHSMLSYGDPTGYKWLQKFGYTSSETVTITGNSSVFSVFEETGKYNLRKQNEDHDHKQALQSYALQPWLKDNYNLWDNVVGPALGDANSSPTSIGKIYYEKISNFVSNNSDIDDCNLDSLYNYALQYKIPMQMYNINYPPSIKRLIDIVSIKHNRLYGAVDTQTDTFDPYTDYTNPLRENLGEELDFENHILTVGDTIIAFEKFSKIYTKINVELPTTGSVDSYGNIVNLTTDSSILISSNTFKLSNYSRFWGWNLIAPDAVNGSDILNYYTFYNYNVSSENTQVEGVINWSDPSTSLTIQDNSYTDWEKDTGVVDNMLEHQLRVGLNMFN